MAGKGGAYALVVRAKEADVDHAARLDRGFGTTRRRWGATAQLRGHETCLLLLVKATSADSHPRVMRFLLLLNVYVAERRVFTHTQPTLDWPSSNGAGMASSESTGGPVRKTNQIKGAVTGQPVDSKEVTATTAP